MELRVKMSPLPHTLDTQLGMQAHDTAKKLGLVFTRRSPMGLRGHEEKPSGPKVCPLTYI